MNDVKLRKWDVAGYLNTEADKLTYLQACLDEAGDDLARSRDIHQDSDRVRTRLAGLALSEEDIQAAVTWARQSSAK